MKVVLFGGRAYDLSAPHWKFLDDIHVQYPMTELIQGEASGADAGGKLWALRTGIDVVGFLCNWTKYGSAAGPRRNDRMLDYLLSFREGNIAGIHFPGMAGTQDMLYRLQRAKVFVFHYKGPVSQKKI